MNYEELRSRVFAYKQKEAAKQLSVEAKRHGDYEALVYAFCIYSGPLAIKDLGKWIILFFKTTEPDNDELLKAQDAYLGLLDKKLVWADEEEFGITKRPVPYKTQKQLQEFVRDCLSGAIFTSHLIRPSDWKNLLGMVFIPIAMGALNSERTDTSTIGVFYEYNSESGPRSINGYPIFFSCHMMHTEDWKRALTAILREQKRMESIQV